MIRGFFAVAAMSFKAQAIYRVNHYLSMFKSLVALVVRLAIWYALYRAVGNTAVAGQTLGDIITYVIISSLTGIFLGVRFSWDMAEALRTGSFATDMLRPPQPRFMFIARSMGESAHALWTQGLPLIAVGIFCAGLLQPPASPLYFLYFLLSLTMGLMIAMCLEMISAMMLFWVRYAWLMDWMIGIVMTLFSGSMVPLWFYPDWLAAIARVLPFQAAYFAPVEVYMGKIPLSQMGALLMTQALWVAAMMALQQVLWRRGLRRITVNGG